QGAGDGSHNDQALPPIRQGEAARFSAVDLSDKMTRPLPYFTDGTLLAAVENVARLVDEPKFKAILDETVGVGTEATRAGINEGAISKGYLVRQKKTIKPSLKGKSVISMVPKVISSPGMTAAWEQELEKIASGQVDLDTFITNLE